MTRVLGVREFLSSEDFKDERERFINEAKAGRSIVSLMIAINELGGNFTKDQVRNWVKQVRFKIGIEAEKINDKNVNYEGLSLSSLLNANICLMHTSLNQLIEEFNRRSLSETAANPISTKDLGTIINNFSARIIAASGEAEKIKTRMDYKGIADAIFDGLLIEAETTYLKDTPETLPILENIIEQYKTKLELE